MKNKIRNKMSLVVIGLLGFLTPFADAENVPASAATASAAATAHHGTLYRVSHKGNTSYLFGTIHVGKPAFYPLGTEVMQAFSKASKVAFELDSQNTAAIIASMQKYGMYKSDDTLKNHLSADTLLQLQQVLEKANLPLDNMMQMKPWVVADIVMASELERNGYAREHGVEEFLLKAARQQKKQVVELESADLQFSLFNQLTEQQQTQFLEEVLQDIADGKMRKETDELAQAWGNADAKELARLIQDNLNEKTVSSEFTQHVLLDQRNPGMATKIEGLLKHDKVTFVGVGLLHLVGDKGVPALLRRRGYAVQRVY